LILNADCSIPWSSGTKNTLPQITAAFGSASAVNSALLSVDLVLLLKKIVYCGAPICKFQILGVGDSLTLVNPATYNQLAMVDDGYVSFKEDSLIPVMSSA
jgi:hypothetical protein